MRMKSAQQIFNQVSRHLIKQNKQSLLPKYIFDGSNFCAYRGKNGLKCAIGALIKDEWYDEDCEGDTMSSSGVSNSLINSGVDAKEHHNLLTTLQITHDCNNPSYWLYKLRQIAKNHKLKPDCLEGVK